MLASFETSKLKALRMSIPTLLEIDDVARLLHVSRSVLAKWRMTGRGPRFIKAGRRVLYDGEELSRWLEAQERATTLA
jgi:hypothetical protein